MDSEHDAPVRRDRRQSLTAIWAVFWIVGKTVDAVFYGERKR